MCEAKIYLELSDEVQKIITQSGMSVDTVLRRAGIDTEITYGESPLQLEQGVKTRELATIIAVSAISAVPAAIALAKLIKSLRKETVIAKYYKLEPVLEPKTGEVLRDKKGNPVMNKIPHFEVTETRAKQIKEEFKRGRGRRRVLL